MPGILATTKWSRRRFLRGTVQAAACAAYPSLVHAADPLQSRRWTLLADTHVAADPLTISGVGGQKPYENLQKTVERIGADPPVGAMIIGDVALSDGQPGDYAAVKTLLKPLSNKVPVFLGMGNHDDREPFLEAFPDGADGGTRPPVKQKHIVVIDQAPVIRIVLLDSLWHVNRVPGELGPDQQTWLQKFLTKSDPLLWMGEDDSDCLAARSLQHGELQQAGINSNKAVERSGARG